MTKVNKVSCAVLAGIAWLGLFFVSQAPAEALYKVKNLVTYGTGVDQDPLLSSAWGLAIREGGLFSVADEATGVVTIYDARGRLIS